MIDRTYKNLAILTLAALALWAITTAGMFAAILYITPWACVITWPAYIAFWYYAIRWLDRQ